MGMILALFIFVILGVIALTIIGLRNPELANEQALQERLEQFSRTGEYVDLRKLELSQPFSQRVIIPIARKLGEIASRLTPANLIQTYNKRLELAGASTFWDGGLVLVAQGLLAIIFGGLIFLIFSLSPTQRPLGNTLFFTFLFAIIGFLFPNMIISSRISRRQREIRKAMPDALDLLTICVEAGLGFDAAMQKVSEKWQSELSLAFARAIQEIQLGKTRREALRSMAERIGIPEMTSFVAAVIQSEMLGVSLAKVLRIQSEQMRMRRRQRAEEEARKAPLKMLIPMALLIFPSLLIVLLTPAALRLFRSALGSMFFQ
ncbi:type II secretion system F family protein [Thermanaerothrix sp.]|jgi:tight adherence protein C|uniref:type II secretion system F family protein n=1 Tax=Thermanaerothrix sp. TaxID=2972675 RepID=UPI002ADE5A69|nr:type II secretion system F family protein [Thermanaerothrix sp.]